MGYHSTGPAYAALLGLLAFGCSGLGRQILRQRSCRLASPNRRLVAEYSLGLLLYVSVFGLLAQISGDGRAAATLVAGCVALGTASLGRAIACKRRALLAVVITLIALATGTTPVNLSAADGWNYAYLAATLFRGDWLTANMVGTANADSLRALTHVGTFTRAAPLALLWPAAALGWPIDARTVASLGALLLVGAAALIADLFRGLAPLGARVLLAVAALGAFNVTAVLTGGQVNQPFAIAVCVAMAWLCWYVENERVSWLVLVLCGAAIACGYPEFLVGVPAYLLCVVVLRRAPVREFAVMVAWLAAGVALAELTTGLQGMEYLLTQATADPQWWPLPGDPVNPVDEWAAVLVQRVPPRLSLVLIVPALWLGWRLSAPAGRPSLWPLACAAALIAGWSMLLTHAANANYATFKLLGWVSPGLLLLVWLARPARPTWLVQAFTAGLLAVAAVRTLGVGAELYGIWPLYSGPPISNPVWRVEAASGSCALTVDAGTLVVLEAAVAGSAAPARGCRLIDAQP